MAPNPTRLPGGRWEFTSNGPNKPSMTESFFFFYNQIPHETDGGDVGSCRNGLATACATQLEMVLAQSQSPAKISGEPTKAFVSPASERFGRNKAAR